MTSSTIFAQLPDMVLNYVLDFANDGPIRVTYNSKKKMFINQINPNFALLNNVNQFKIDNPPEYYIDDPNFDEEFDTSTLDIIITLTFKFPFKLRPRKEFFDRFYMHSDNSLMLTYIYNMNFNDFTTKECTIMIPNYYRSIATKAIVHYKSQLKKKLSFKQKSRVRNMVRGFQTMSYASDVIIE